MIAQIILTAVFIFFWQFIGKYPELFVKIFIYAQQQYPAKQILHVFSAETPNRKEAEFINESLPERQVTRFLRFALLILFSLITVYLLFR